MIETPTVYPQAFDYYNFCVIENLVCKEEKPAISASYEYEENGVLYCTTGTEKERYIGNRLGSYVSETTTNQSIWFSEIENACGWQSRQVVQARLCGGISADLTFLLLFWSSKKVEEKNMNGRLYDPVIARFFSPDKYVANSSFTQDFNRYSYARNCPLMYTDPDGEFIHFIIGAVVGFINGLGQGAKIANDKGATGWAKFGYMMAAAHIGAGIGAATAGIGAGISSALAPAGSFTAGFVGTSAVSTTGFVAGAVTGVVSGTAGGFLSGASNSWLGGSSFGKGLLDGLKEGAMSGLLGGITGGLMGGIDAASNGRDFWTGSFKQYDLPVNYIASTDNNMLFDQYSFPDNATVANGDQYKVYYKPEDGVYGIKNYVEPGKYITKPVDGIATSKYSDMVFKIPDGGRVKVSFGGKVEFTSGIKYDVANLIGYRAGWKDAQYFINRGAYYGKDGWEILFKLALIIK